MRVASTVFNALLSLVMNWTVFLRWKQMRKNVPYNQALAILIGVVLTILVVLKIAAHVYQTYALGANSADTSTAFLATSSAALVLVSILFDITICLMISRAVFRAQGLVNRTLEQQDSLRRVLRNFRVSLAALVFVDIFQLGIASGLNPFSQFSGAVICITVSMFVIHCLVSDNLLKNFVKQIWSRSEGSNSNIGLTHTTTLRSKAGK